MKRGRFIAALAALALVIAAMPALNIQAAYNINGWFSTESSGSYSSARFNFKADGTVDIERDYGDSGTYKYAISGDNITVDYSEFLLEIFIIDDELLCPNNWDSSNAFGNYLYKDAQVAELSNVHYDPDSGLVFNYPDTVELLTDRLTSDPSEAAAIRAGGYSYHLMFFDRDAEYRELSEAGYSDFEILESFINAFLTDYSSEIYGVYEPYYDVDGGSYSVPIDLEAQYDEKGEAIAFSRTNLRVLGGGNQWIVYGELTNAGDGRAALTVMIYPRNHITFVSVLNEIMLSLRFSGDGTYSAAYNPRVPAREEWEEPSVYVPQTVRFLSAEPVDGKLRFIFEYDKPQGHLTIELFTDAGSYIFGYETKNELDKESGTHNINWDYTCFDGTKAADGLYMMRFWTDESPEMDEEFEYFYVDRE
ncbi:MAG: hypothetical protein LBS19_15160 [Clostridiales bacterium]|jgi:flagellar hook assembly protein FlgD|nr:hypothetical protein [Clostridiales bacterium]